ncbi:CU044_2847 family protein [Streptomyces sp. NPDC001832]|uniref:CU044_2847 family protein n=1 Tax=Streptomyces sp. NPDC001832 TaxID=3154527 RepID=UPI0033262099
MRLRSGSRAREVLSVSSGCRSPGPYAGCLLTGSPQGWDRSRGGQPTTDRVPRVRRSGLEDQRGRSVRGLVSQPGSVSVEFGTKLSAEAGVVVAQAAGEANFAVCLEWNAANRDDAGHGSVTE